MADEPPVCESRRAVCFGIELAELALEIDEGFSGAPYRATAEEVAGIERGLKDAGEGRFATAEQVKAVFDKFRRA